MLSGAPILLLIVALWAAYLVPMFLTRYDRATESRSVDRFSTAMRSLGRRDPDRGNRAGSRSVLMPARPVAPAAAPRGPRATAATSRPAARTASRPTAPRPPSAALLARRRTVTLALLGAAVVLGLAAVVGVPGALGLHLVADVLLVAYVGHLRLQARRAEVLRAAARRTASARRPQPAPRRSDVPAPRRRTDLDSWLPRRIPSPETLAAAVRPVAPPVPVPAVAQRRVPPLVVEFDLDAGREAEPVRATGTGGAWSPVPVPPPVYTTKPVAPGRVLDLTVPGAWTAANVLHDLEQDDADLERSAAQDETLDLDEVLEHRWAVND